MKFLIDLKFFHHGTVSFRPMVIVTLSIVVTLLLLGPQPVSTASSSAYSGPSTANAIVTSRVNQGGIEGIGKY